MISGALFLNEKKKITYRSIITKYIPRILLAYVFWSVFYYLCGYAIGDYEDLSIRQMLQSQRYYHLWFLPMLMGVYLLIPILRTIVKDQKILVYSLLIWGIYVCVSFLSFMSVFQWAKHFYVLFKMNSVVGFSGYFLLGHYLSQRDFSKKARAIPLSGWCNGSIGHNRGNTLYVY